MPRPPEPMTPRPTSRLTRARRRAPMLALLATAFVMAPFVGAPAPVQAASPADWTTSATVSADTIAPQQTLTITVRVTSAKPALALVDAEVYSATGQKVFQQWWDAQSYTAGGSQTYTTSWKIPSGEPAGDYTVKIGIFAVGWINLAAWNDVADTFRITSATPSTTVAPTVPPTTAPRTTTTVRATTTTAPPPPVTTAAPATTAAPTTTVAPATTAATTTTVAPATTAAPTTTAAPVTTTTAPANTPRPPAQFFEDFSSPASVNRFQVEVHDPTIQAPLPEWFADHNGMCNGPTTQRTVHYDNPAESFFYCAPAGPDSGHIMTSMQTFEYAHVDFAPAQVFNDVSQVCWDVNQTQMGQRKWINILVVPESDYQAAGNVLRFTQPEFDVSSTPFWGGVPMPSNGFFMSMLEGSTQTFVGQQLIGVDFGGFVAGDDRATRFHHCMTDTGSGIAFDLQRDNRVDHRTLPGAFPDGPVRVIFQDASYDPFKGRLDYDQTLHTTTWHWDNIEIR